MSLPRPVYPGSMLMVTRRCTQRQFLLRPDKDSNNAVIYCLALAAQRFNIDVIGFVQMSNHLHEVIYDRDGNAPAFYEHFHKLLAKCMNNLRGRWENFFASEQVSVVRLEDREALIDKLTYVITNPVKDGLVGRVHHWPGANGFNALTTGKPLHAKRPRYYFDADGSMPSEITLEVRVPPEIEEAGELIAAVKECVATVEHAKERERAENGERLVGRSAVRHQDWRAFPRSRGRHRNLRPTVATRNRWARIEALARNRVFVAKYRIARQAHLLGEPIAFPPGTYWLRLHMHVATSPS